MSATRVPKTQSSSVCRVNKNGNYTVMSNYHLRSTAIGLKAIGLLSRVLNLPEEWDYSVAGLTAICKEKETAVKSALAELKEWGYLTVTKLLPNETENGRFDYIYDFYECSEKDKSTKSLPSGYAQAAKDAAQKKTSTVCRVNKNGNYCSPN